MDKLIQVEKLLTSSVREPLGESRGSPVGERNFLLLEWLALLSSKGS